MAQTYDISQNTDTYIAVSKFFECPPGKGTTEEEAILDLEKNIRYLSNNKKNSYKAGLLKQIEYHRANGEIPLFIYKG